jgi:hypothetical protein
MFFSGILAIGELVLSFWDNFVSTTVLMFNIDFTLTF